ncbi:MAG: serine/threonine protein kinase, partial [Kiritimatiellaeota bacterium]|nr:serine/threonine protein kinase [Kiritimatiellota bacterium]
MKVELDGFKFLGHIGTGGMASVWRARQLSLDRDVAVKILSPKFAMAPDDVARFLSEARLAAKLKHPGIVQVYDAISQGGIHCFVMEYVAGYTVGQWMRRKEKLSESETLVIAECVAQALGYAWKQHKMVHCDIKPDNVMVDADGTVKLADMGLSRMYGVMRHGSGDDVFGTPAFMAPEQVQGKAVDCRADMYSLGAMLYYLVSATLLFAGESDEKVMECQVSERVPHLRKLRPELSIAFCDLVERLLAKRPEDRYPSWDAVLADIAAVAKKWPLTGGVPELNVGTMLSDPTLKRPKTVRMRETSSYGAERTPSSP